MSQAELFAQAAASLIGTKFRLHGRSPATGVDCVGLVCLSLAAVGKKPSFPEGYMLRNSSALPWLRYAKASGLSQASGSIKRGDVILYVPAPGQQHLVIAETSSVFVHAHCGLKRVVRQTLDLPPATIAHWRLDD